MYCAQLALPLPPINLLNYKFMLKEILAVSGKPGLYKLVSRGSNMLIIESLVDKKRIPAYSRDKVISLGDISIYTDEEEAPIREVFTSIKEKEGGKNISLDLSKASTDELRNYLAEVLPNFDRERVYPSDIKKMLKWYDLLITNDITDFSEKKEDTEEEKAADGESGESAEDEKTKTKSAAKATKTSSTKRKESSLTPTKTASVPKAKSTPKTSTPKKNVVGAKRGG